MNTNSSLATLTGISLETAIQRAPAIAATKAAPPPYTGGPRSKYKFAPSTELIGHMQDLGYILTDAKQSTTKDPIRKEFGAHMMMFQHPDLYIKAQDGGVEARPQIVMINSHDGTRHHTMEMGIFRLICSNGLMVKSMDMGSFKERHSKLTIDDVKARIDERTGALPLVMERINSMASRDMSAAERKAFATAALALRLGEDRLAEDHEIYSLLSPKRTADEGTDLWRVYNTVQENLVRGGFSVGERSARAITNPWVDLQLNNGLWSLAQDLVS